MLQTGDPAHLPAISGVELLEEIGRGGMGVVYLGRQPKLDRLIAVKVLRSWTGVDDELVERFLREARAAALTDAAIVPLYDVGVVDDTHYLVMAYMPGGSLRQVIESRRLAPAEVVMVGRRVAGALATAHAAGVLHRDVKPSNILLDARGNPFLSDFGIAQLAGLTRLTRSGASPGTAEYMAPELATGAAHSEAADLYSLGATLYECVTGQPPFTGANHLAVIYRHSHDPVPPLPDDVPEPLARAIIRSLAKGPEERFPSAAALEAALAEVPAEPVAVQRESPTSLGKQPQEAVPGMVALATAPAEPSADPEESVPAVPAARPTLSVAGRRLADAPPKRPHRLGRLGAAVPARLAALGAGALMAVLVLATVASIVLPRVIHPTTSGQAPTHHRGATSARHTPARISVATATGPGPKSLPAAPKPAPAAAAASAPAPVPTRPAGPASIIYNGSVNVFARGADGTLENYYSTPGVGWTLQSLGGQITGDPAAWLYGNSVNVFARGSDGSLWNYYDTPGVGWTRQSLGGHILDDPTVTQLQNSVNVFARGSDGTLFNYYNTPGVGWTLQSLGGQITGDPAAWLYGNSVNVFARGSDGTLLNYYNTPGVGWTRQSLGGQLLGDPSVTQLQNSVNVFARGSDGTLFNYYNTPGAGWTLQSLGGQITGDPAAWLYGNSVNVFARGSDGTLLNYYNTPGVGWTRQSLGGQPAGDPAVTQLQNSVNVFVQGTDDALWNYYNTPGVGWTIQSLGGSLSAGP